MKATGERKNITYKENSIRVSAELAETSKARGSGMKYLMYENRSMFSQEPSIQQEHHSHLKESFKYFPERQWLKEFRRMKLALQEILKVLVQMKMFIGPAFTSDYIHLYVRHEGGRPITYP